MVFPFTQVIVTGFKTLLTAITAGGDAAGVIAGAVGAVVMAAAWANLIRIVGEEKVKLSACNFMKPSFSFTNTVAIWLELSDERTSIFASIGALEKP